MKALLFSVNVSYTSSPVVSVIIEVKECCRGYATASLIAVPSPSLPPKKLKKSKAGGTASLYSLCSKSLLIA